MAKRYVKQGQVHCHPYIVGELSCGTPPQRRFYIDFLSNLESGPVATNEEVLATIEAHKFFGQGCGYVDMCLMASVLISEKSLIWTLDKSLGKVASALGKAYTEKLNS